MNGPDKSPDAPAVHVHPYYQGRQDYAKRLTSSCQGVVLIPGAFLPCHERTQMATLKPGQNTGNGGGIFQEQGPKGGKQPNFSTVPDHRPMPPTTKPGNVWAPVKTTPNSKR